MSSKTRLIALHGWAMSPAAFRYQGAGFPDQLELLTPALPGYPASVWSAGLSFEQQVKTMAADLPTGHLLGWSLGGIYALYLYHAFPHQFSGLTLVCFNPCFVKRPDWPCGVDSAVFDQFEKDLERGWPSTIRRFLNLQLHGQDGARSMVRDLTMVMSQQGIPDHQVLYQGLELLRQSDTRELLFSLKRPLQMIFAENDPLVATDCAKQIIQIAPAIQVECIAGATHLPFLSHADQFRQLLTKGATHH